MNGWATIVLSSFAPVGSDGIARRDDEVDWSDTWRRFAAGLSSKARAGALLAVVIAFTSPVWALGRFATLGMLSAARRAEAMDALLRHPIHLVRELTLMLKVCACFALFRSEAVRSRTGYDRPARRALPVLTEVAA